MPAKKPTQKGLAIVHPDGHWELGYFYHTDWQCSGPEGKRPCTAAEWLVQHRPGCKLIWIEARQVGPAIASAPKRTQRAGAGEG